MLDSIKKYADRDIEKMSDKELEDLCQAEKLNIRGKENSRPNDNGDF